MAAVVHMCACGCSRELYKNSGKNAMSRYVPVHIHPQCGIKEAFEGFYWRARWERLESTLRHNMKFFESFHYPPE